MEFRTPEILLKDLDLWCNCPLRHADTIIGLLAGESDEGVSLIEEKYVSLTRLEKLLLARHMNDNESETDGTGKGKRALRGTVPEDEMWENGKSTVLFHLDLSKQRKLNNFPVLDRISIAVSDLVQ